MRGILEVVPTDTFAVLAEPIRRRILDELVEADAERRHAGQRPRAAPAHGVEALAGAP